MKVKIVEVGPRDGLQNETTPLSVADRILFIKQLASAGLNKIEAGAFVSPKKIPQMASSSEVFLGLKEFKTKARFSALIPNLQGMDEAIKVGVGEIALFTAASESFTKSNINCTIDESFERIFPVVKIAKQKKIPVRGYVSTAFGCPYEGKVDTKRVVEVILKLIKIGCYEVSVGDTIGVASPKQVLALIKRLRERTPLNKIAMHFHDTRGTALANIHTSIQQGIRTFDSSLGGLGGCPYAPGASGNVATEDVVYMLQTMGIETGIDLRHLLKINAWVAALLGRQLPAKLGQAGLPKNFGT